MVENWCDDERDLKSEQLRQHTKPSDTISVADMAKSMATQDHNGYNESKYVVYNYEDYNKSIEDYIIQRNMQHFEEVVKPLLVTPTTTDTLFPAEKMKFADS